MSILHDNEKRILFLVPYPLKCSPSQRFRFEQYLKYFKDEDISYDVLSFLDSQGWDVIYRSGNFTKKAFVILDGFWRRTKSIVKIRAYDFVFIHREVTPIGPAIFEWIIAKIFKKKIIYDFDDAIWLADASYESPIERLLKSRSKVKNICRWSYKISCGNEYLASYAKTFNSQVVINPTTIDTEGLHVRSVMKVKQTTDHINIGWTGSHSTIKYLTQIIPVMSKLMDEYQTISFTIIANVQPALKIKHTFIKWNLETEIEDLSLFDIGIMPLHNDEWTKGKCGFKALQYMAMGIPVVASPVGVNSSIVQQGVNGFLAETEDQWYEMLKTLISNEKLRLTLGRAGRETVVKQFSVTSNKQNFLSLFN